MECFVYPRGEVLRQQSKIQYIVYKENLLVHDKNKSKVNIRTEMSHTHSSRRAQVVRRDISYLTEVRPAPTQGFPVTEGPYRRRE